VVIDLEEFGLRSEKSSVGDAGVDDRSQQGASTTKRTASRVVRVPLERLDALIKLISELVISRAVLEQRMSDFTARWTNSKTAAIVCSASQPN